MSVLVDIAIGLIVVFIVFSIIQAAGWPIWPLLLASIIAVALIIERAAAAPSAAAAAGSLRAPALSAGRPKSAGSSPASARLSWGKGTENMPDGCTPRDRRVQARR